MVTVNTAGQLADRLVEFSVEQLDMLARRHLHDLELPGTYGGHPVGADVRADLLYTLGHLGDAGVDAIAGRSIDAHLAHHLGRVDGRSTHTFFSYRVAETVARAGRFANNPLLAALDENQRAQVAMACDSTDWLALLEEGALPRNYAAVLARCELARDRLGLPVDQAALESLVGRAAAVLGSNPSRYLDDSNDGSGRYDIYTADVWLFCEPLAPRLGDMWAEGITAALALVDAVGARDGTAIAWGRSTGVLAVALTIELAALTLANDLAPTRAGAWLQRAIDATASMEHWYRDGVVSAHQYRDQDAYRGPARRLQLTLDVLGKLAWAAKTLRAGEARAVTPGATGVEGSYPPIDRIIAFERDRHAAVWAYRDANVEFALPFVGAARSHYYPAPHAPGCFEVPVDADLPCWTPLIHSGGGRYAGGGLPASLDHAAGTLDARWQGFPATRFEWNEVAPPPLDGSRAAKYRVEGRSLIVDELLTFAAPPDAVTVLVPEREGRPLHVEFASDDPHTVTAVDVRGLAEWRSSWSELAVAHQLDLVPTTALRYSIRVTPKLRVVSTASGHHYHDSLYDQMSDSVVSLPNPLGPLGDESVQLEDVDLFHMHWPEWVAFADANEHAAIIAALGERGIPIVWTAHNLTPHEKNPEAYDVIYGLWAEAADAVVHHSRFGEQRMRERYRFPPHCRHEVIAHGHFGDLWADVTALDRAVIEADLGFASCSVRIGILGAPRAEKRVVDFLEGFAACSRDDFQVACWSLAYHEPDLVPSDPRIVAAEVYHGVSTREFARRLAVCDVLALPFDPAGEMLATGTAADALGLAKPVLISDWEYLTEVFGDAAIPCGHTAVSVTACLDTLTVAALAAAAVSMTARREQYDWSTIAARTYDLFEDVVEQARARSV
jgi:glycosyltransferase involved in cell wall biosynthesis